MTKFEGVPVAVPVPPILAAKQIDITSPVAMDLQPARPDSLENDYVSGYGRDSRVLRMTLEGSNQLGDNRLADWYHHSRRGRVTDEHTEKLRRIITLSSPIFDV